MLIDSQLRFQRMVSGTRCAEGLRAEIMTNDRKNSSNVTMTADRPAQFRKAIAFTCDENFLPFAAHAAVQICDQNPDRDFDVCLVCGDGQSIALPESLQDYGIRVCHIESGNAFDGIKLAPGRTHVVYIRMCMPLAFQADYDRILYLDSDVFVQGGDFSALLDIDMGPHCIGAIRDNEQWRTPDRVIAGAKLPGKPMARYFNSGVLLMDVQKYIDFKLMEKCVEIGRQETKNDQNLYNSVLQGAWAELSPMWNWQFTWASRFFATVESPHIVHFIGPAKPWKDRTGQFERRFISSFAAFTKRHFPEFDLPDIAEHRLAPDSKKTAKMLIKHFMSRKKLARYLRRFPTDMTVHL